VKYDQVGTLVASQGAGQLERGCRARGEISRMKESAVLEHDPGPLKAAWNNVSNAHAASISRRIGRHPVEVERGRGREGKTGTVRTRTIMGQERTHQVFVE
jgi:hypothetical protein